MTHSSSHRRWRNLLGLIHRPARPNYIVYCWRKDTRRCPWVSRRWLRTVRRGSTWPWRTDLSTLSHTSRTAKLLTWSIQKFVTALTSCVACVVGALQYAPAPCKWRLHQPPTAFSLEVIAHVSVGFRAPSVLPSLKFVDMADFR